MFLIAVVIVFRKGCDPNVKYTVWIRKNYTFLLQNLESVFSGLIDHLYQYKVFDQAECELVRTERTSAKQNERLLSILDLKSPEKINLFFYALDETNQSHIKRQTARTPAGTTQSM